MRLFEAVRLFPSALKALYHHPVECMYGFICLVFVRLYLAKLSQEIE